MEIYSIFPKKFHTNRVSSALTRTSDPRIRVLLFSLLYLKNRKKNLDCSHNENTIVYSYIRVGFSSVGADFLFVFVRGIRSVALSHVVRVSSWFISKNLHFFSSSSPPSFRLYSAGKLYLRFTEKIIIASFPVNFPRRFITRWIVTIFFGFHSRRRAWDVV